MLAEHAGWHVEMVRKSHPSTHLNLCELRPGPRFLDLDSLPGCMKSQLIRHVTASFGKC